MQIKHFMSVCKAMIEQSEDDTKTAVRSINDKAADVVHTLHQESKRESECAPVTEANSELVVVMDKCGVIYETPRIEGNALDVDPRMNPQGEGGRIDDVNALDNMVTTKGNDDEICL
eukprot:994259_1